MTKLSLVKLRAIAKAATPGPWLQNFTTVELPAVGFYQQPICHCKVENPIQHGSDSPNYHNNAAHIAATSPETVLALLDVIEQMRGALKMYTSLREEARHWPDNNRYSYLETPALETLAAVSEKLEFGE